MYIIPPASSQQNAAGEIAEKSGLKANTQSQPIIIYMVEFNHLGEFIQNTERKSPAKVSPHIIESSGMPTFLGRAIIHIGVYVPAIRKYIII